MLSNPKQGDRVEVRYRKGVREHMPHHGKLGTVEIVGKGRPRNHGVRIDFGELTVIPAGNLFRSMYHHPECDCEWCDERNGVDLFDEGE